MIPDDAKRTGHAPRYRWSVLLLVVLYAAQTIWHSLAMSPVEAEIVQLPAGLSHWLGYGFGAYRQVPPLVRLVAASPFLIESPEVNWASFPQGDYDRTEGPLGRDFVRANRDRFLFYYRVGRLCCLPLMLLGLWVTIRWAAAIHGPAGGLIAGGLYAFCPLLIGHGALITSDAAAAAMGVISTYCFAMWVARPSAFSTLCSGLCLGLAVATKTTLVALPLGWAFAILLYRFACRRTLPDARRSAILIMPMLLAALFALNATYFFQRSFESVSGIAFRSAAFSDVFGPPSMSDNPRAESLLRKLPLPLPLDFVLGVDLQISDFERSPFPSYAWGEWSKRGWWWYYALVLLVKLPVTSVLLCLCGLGLLLSRRPHSIDQLLVLAGILSISIVVSSNSGFSVHGRYILPVVPFLYIAAGGIGPIASKNSVAGLLVLVALAYGGIDVARNSPHNLGYFSSGVGGWRYGADYLLDSNLGWGQDLLHLKSWCDNRELSEPLFYASPFGVDPELLGIPLANENELVSEAWYAIDVNCLYGSGLPMRGNLPVPGNDRAELSSRLSELRHASPEAILGTSIYIFRGRTLTGVEPP